MPCNSYTKGQKTQIQLFVNATGGLCKAIDQRRSATYQYRSRYHLNWHEDDSLHIGLAQHMPIGAAFASSPFLSSFYSLSTVLETVGVIENQTRPRFTRCLGYVSINSRASGISYCFISCLRRSTGSSSSDAHRGFILRMACAITCHVHSLPVYSFFNLVVTPKKFVSNIITVREPAALLT